jgi:di/tricarboxylate transporter
MFDLAWVGVPITIAGILFMMLTSRWLLPDSREPALDLTFRRRFGADFRVLPGSRLAGKTLAASGFLDADDFKLVSITREDGESVEIQPGTRLTPNDVLLFRCLVEALPGLWRTEGLIPKLESGRLGSDRFRHTLVEVTLSRRCSFLGQPSGQMRPDSPYKAKVLAASRGGQPFHPTVPGEFERIERRDKATAAILITMGMVVTAAMGWMSMLNAALLASGLMVLTGCISLTSAGRSIDFTTLIVIACAIGLESSVSATGLSGIIAGALGQIGGDSAVIALIAIFTGCIVMDTLITNVASAAFMYPIAVVLAGNLGVDFMPFAVTLMVGASCSFISPMGYQTNLMVYGPGKYSFIDYVRIGVPLTVLVGVITVYLAPIVFPF